MDLRERVVGVVEPESLSRRKPCLAGSRYVERVLPPAFKAGGSSS